ncbi:MAG: oligosaccharide flippase family protein, partial [Anaerolineae bacterium]|nr:oligosaccharide flippase family protein [Anaerolineae bacterium]
MGIIQRLSQYQIAKNTSVLAVAQITSRAFAILYVAALSRYVGTEGIGQISTATSLNAILLLIVGPGLTYLLVRDVASDKSKASTYVSSMLFLRLAFIVPFIALTVLLAYSGRYSRETAVIIHLYTAVYVLDTMGEIMIATFQAYEHMEYEAGLQITRDAVNIIVSLLAIAWGWPLIGIVA